MWLLAERNTLTCSEFGEKVERLRPVKGVPSYTPVSAIYPSKEIAGEFRGVAVS